MFIPAVQPALLIGSAVAAFWYWRRSRAARSSQGWPWWRTLLFIGGLAGALAVTCGPVQHATRASFTLYVSQCLALLLVLPVLLVAGQPVQLASVAGSRLARLPHTSLGRALYSPVVGAGLVPVTCVALLFGPVPGWAIRSQPFDWLLQLAVVIVGSAIALPLIGMDDTLGSLAVAAATAIGLVELLLDAVPGIVMRLSTRPVTSFFRYRAVVPGQFPWLRDQQIAGAVLWTVAELLDLPFLILVFRKWIAADAREAATADAEHPTPEPGTDPGGERPWFLDDPRLRDRFR